MAEIIGLAASIVGLIQLTGKIVTVGYGYIGGVNRARKDLRELMDELHSLTKVLVVLEDYVNTSPESTALQTLNEPLQRCVEELQELYLELEPKNRMDKFKWPLKEKEAQQRISRIERFKGLFSFAIAADNITLSKSIEGHVKKTSAAVLDIETSLQGTNDVVQGIETAVQIANVAIQNESMAQSSRQQQEEIRRNAENREMALEWLYSDDFNAAHLDISKGRQINTGNWLLESPEFRGWAEGHPKSRLLWGPGIPGAGKTYLCSRVIDHFKAQELAANYGLAHIYFNYKEQEQQMPLQILSSLLKQLGSRIPQLPRAIGDLHKKSKEEKKRPTTEDLYTALIETSKPFSRVFFVFDALDECHPEARAELLPIFQRMGKDGISVFLTSRPHPEDIQNCLSSAMKIGLSAQAEDVVTYIRERIRNNQRTRSHVQKAKCEDRMISELVDCAQGMFLLVRFHMDFLCQQINPRQLLRALDQIKGSSTGKRQLDATYERAMESIQRQDEGSADLAFSILSWLVKAKRTLTVEELQIAMAVEQEEYELDELNITEKQTLVDVCASLVIIDELSGTIKLAHYTVQEYLVEKSIAFLDADFKLAMACTTYLTFDVFANGPCSSYELMLERLETHPFLDYAANYLVTHLQACSEDLTANLLLQFVENLGCVDSYLQVLIFELGYETSYQWHSSENPLHMASRFGHSVVVGQLLEKGVEIGAVNKRKETPLFVAAEAGHEAVVRLLLEKGASLDISVIDEDGRTTLFVAVEEGHEIVVRLLLDKGAMPNISVPDEDGRTPLHAAAEEGHEAVARLLLENGAMSDISVLDTSGRTPLYTAAEAGHEAIVRILLEKAATSDISISNEDGETPLYVAAWAGHEAIVRLLLEKGAISDILVPDTFGRTPLYTAAEAGHEAIVQLLLEKGAISKISAPDRLGRTPLFSAALVGHEAIVRLLLEKGAISETSVPDTFGRTPLYAAAEAGHEAIVRLLLEKGAIPDISASDGSGRTPLDVAVEAGHEAIIRLLRAKGELSYTSVPDKYGRIPQCVAEKAGHQEVARLLLEKEAM